MHRRTDHPPKSSGKNSVPQLGHQINAGKSITTAQLAAIISAGVFLGSLTMRLALPLFFLTSICLGLGGCGQKGPLFIPSDDSAPTQPSTPSQPAQQPTPQPAP
jgi:predicted small lipoprotein YifL